VVVGGVGSRTAINFSKERYSAQVIEKHYISAKQVKYKGFSTLFVELFHKFKWANLPKGRDAKPWV